MRNQGILGSFFLKIPLLWKKLGYFNTVFVTLNYEIIEIFGSENLQVWLKPDSCMGFSG